MKIKKGLEKEFKQFVEINKDEYGKSTVEFSIRWADLMEKEKTLTKSRAKELSYKADTDGITGFMYDMARQFLHKYWEYGEKLTKLIGDKRL